MNQAIENAVKILMFEEGFRAYPYYCTEGYPTVGYGFRIGNKGDVLPDIRLTEEFAASHLGLLVDEHYRACKVLAPSAPSYVLSVLISMSYQIGVAGLSKFKKTLDHIAYGRNIDASVEMLDSKWAKQTRSRALRHSEVVRRNNLKNVYNFG